MNIRKMLIPLLLFTAFSSFACVYVVVPEGLEAAGADPGVSEAGAWNAVVTNVGTSETGELHIDITIRNDTGDWSTMQAMKNKPAVLTTGDGNTISCGTVFMGTGGHRLAPGFQMRGYTIKNGGQQEVQLLYVECEEAVDTAGASLSIEYVSYNGILDDYAPEAKSFEGALELKLDEVSADLTYPVAIPVDGLIAEAGIPITALSDNIVTLLDAQRTDTGLEFEWQNFNPTKFPLKTHIGIPPVIGSDGILYGVYETLDIAPVDITPPNENMVWTTAVEVPNEVKGLYILLSVESRKPRTYINYALDITDK